MFFCGKWVTSGGLLEGPWIEGKFNGNVPEYIQLKANHNVQHVCNDLMEVVKSSSRNMKHRISLRLSAELSYGVCSMYKKKVKQLLKDCMEKYKHTPEADVSAHETMESDDSGPSETMSENCRSSVDVEGDTNNSSENGLDPGIVRCTVPSPEYGNVSPGLPSNSENDITVISCPPHLDPPTMLSCNTAEDNIKAGTSTVLEMETNTTGLITDSTFNAHQITVQENITDILLDDTSVRFSVNLQDEDNRVKHSSNDEMNVLSDMTKLKAVCYKEDDLNKSDYYSRQSVTGCDVSDTSTCSGRKRSRDQSSDGEDEARKYTLNVSYGCLQTFKIQDTYENFMRQSHLEDVDDGCTLHMKRKRVCMRDNNTTLSERNLRRNILNPQCHLRSKEDNPREVCRMEVSGEDVWEASGRGMLHVTCRKKISNIGDVTPINIISPDARSIVDAVQLQSIENISNMTTKHADISTSNSSQSLLCIEVPSPPTTNNHSDEEIQIRNVSTSSGLEDVRMSSDAEDMPHTGVVNVILPMHLRHRVDPQEIKIVVGSMGDCGDVQIQMHSDMEYESSSSNSTLFSRRNILSPLNDKLSREWGEDGVYRKLVTLWRHIRMVSPERLVTQGSHCGDIHMAKARMFHSILCLKAKGIIKCIRSINGETKYIIKGSITRKHCANLTD